MRKSAAFHLLNAVVMPRSGVVASLVLVLGAFVTPRADAASVQDRLLQEIVRVERELRQVTSPEERGSAELRLGRAADAARHGRVFLALHELSAIWRMQASFGFAARLKDRVKTVEAFKREWMAAGEPSPPASAADLPLVVAALATSSESAAPATYRASLPYAEEAGLDGGLFYLGDAKAAAAFGAFCRTLRFEAAGKRPPLRSIASEMDDFERDVFKLYDRADDNTRRSFIVINVGMKIARERDASGDHAAALLQYLLARYQLGLVVTRQPAADTPARLDAFSRVLTGADHTIALLFLEMAAAGLASTEAAGPRGATAIVDFVLHEYVEVVKK